jgi:hypothetical protein
MLLTLPLNFEAVTEAEACACRDVAQIHASVEWRAVSATTAKP